MNKVLRTYTGLKKICYLSFPLNTSAMDWIVPSPPPIQITYSCVEALTLNVMFWRWRLWEVIKFRRDHTGGPYDGISAVRRDTREPSLSLSLFLSVPCCPPHPHLHHVPCSFPKWGYSENSAICKPAREFLPDPPWWHPDLKFPASRIMRK